MRLPIIAAAAALSASPALAAPPPFVGDWSGGPATCSAPFHFTEKSYAGPGVRSMRIQKIERNGTWYSLQFADGYRLTLADVKKKTMTWHSPISGDTFDLERCPV